MFLFLGIVLVSVIYLSKRMNHYFTTEEIKYWYILFGSLLVIMIAGMAIFSNSTSIFGSLIYQLAAVITGFILYFLMAVLIIDLAFVIIKGPPLIYGVSAFVLTSLLVVYGIIHAFNVKSRNFEVSLTGLKKDFRIVHLSDVHIGHFRGVKFLDKIINLSLSQDPDAIFITGDLFDGRIQLSEEVLEPLKKVKVPIYFVEGNHDRYTGVSTIKEYLRNKNVQVLENEVAMLGELQIVGLNHMRADGNTRNMHANGGKTIEGTLDTLAVDKSYPTVLLHHSPEGAKYADKHGIDLYLSGHTHGGQLFPITLLNEVLFPYNRGMNSYNDLKVFVSEGVGTFGPPLRIGTKSEVVVIDLLPG
jgi:uncharacterized protein